MSEMRILTVRQPWAWAIIHGGKDVENRVRNVAGSYRGPVAIHAGLGNDLDAWKQLFRTSAAAWSRAMNARESLLSGAIIGVVDLVDAHLVKQSVGVSNVCFDDHTPVGGICSPWAQHYSQFPANRGYHLVFENPRRLAEPILYKGALGLRTLPENVAAHVRAGVTS